MMHGGLQRQAAALRDTCAQMDRLRRETEDIEQGIAGAEVSRKLHLSFVRLVATVMNLLPQAHRHQLPPTSFVQKICNSWWERIEEHCQGMLATPICVV